MPDETKLAQLVADLGAECIKLDAKVDGLSGRLAVESGAIAGLSGAIEELQKKYRLLYDAHMALQSKVYRLENQR